MMAGFPQERGGSQAGYESRLASLAMEITRMNMSDQILAFIRSWAESREYPYRYVTISKYQ